MKVETTVITKVRLYMDNGESSYPLFESHDSEESEEVFADAEIAKQQGELAIEIVENLFRNPCDIERAHVLRIYDTLADNDVLKEVPKYREELEWITQTRQFYAEGKRVAGVKVCRDGTGWGLKEALDYCDANFRRPTV